MSAKEIIRSHVKQNIKGIMLILTIIAIFSVTELVAAYLLGDLIDSLSSSSYTRLLRISMLVLINFVVNSLCRFLRKYQSAKVCQSTVLQLKKDIVKAVMFARVDALGKNYEATLSSIMMNEVNVAAQTISSTLISMLQEPTIAIFSILYIGVFVDWRMALIVCVSAPVTIVLGNYFGKRLKNVNDSFYNNNEKSNKFIIDSLLGIKIVKAYLREKNISNRIGIINNKMKKEQLKQSYYQGLNESIIIFAGFISYLGLYFFGGIFVENNVISVGDLVSAFQLVSFITWPIAGFGNAIASYRSNLAAWNRISDILNIPQEVAEEDKAKENIQLLETIDTLELNDMSFCYPNVKKNVLKDVKCTIQRGDIVALVGHNGTGKTTLINLLLRFYEPTKGTIKMNGIDYQDIDVFDVRKQIAYVSQEIFIWDGSLRENIMFGTEEDTNLEDYKEVLEELELYEMYKQEEVHTNFSSENLSVGFKQRLALARAIVADCPIVLIDEGTANIDKRTEKTISDNFSKWFKDKIVIIIAHGIIAYEVSNRFVLLDDGQLHEVEKNDPRIVHLLSND